MFRRLAKPGESVVRFDLASEERRLARHLSVVIKQAENFAIPDEGLLDNGAESLIEREWRLPYPLITVEHCCSVTREKFVAVAWEEDREGRVILISGAFCSANSARWFPSPFGFRVSPCSFNFGGPQQVGFPSIKAPVQACEYVANTLLWMTTELIEALSCRNVSTDIYQEEHKSNKKRISKGKLPFYETKTLVVYTHKSTGARQHNGKDTQASRRQHLRRGHIRRLESGNVWVNACVVGDPEQGNIRKKYQVKHIIKGME